MPSLSDQNADDFATLSEREAATREILQIISQSRDDEKPVFDAILENAARLCRAPMARLYLVNPQRTHFAMIRDWGEPLRTIEPGFRWPLDSDSNLAKAIRSRNTVHVADMRNNESYRAGDPIQIQLVDSEGLRTQLSVPLIKDDIAIGCITLSRRDVKPFNDAHIGLVETFAAQAVIAIENARQFSDIQIANEELHGRLEREAATREILQVISKSRDDEMPVFEVLLANSARLCSAPLAWLALANESRTHFTLAATYGETPREFRVGEVFSLDAQFHLSRAISEARTFNIEDLKEGDLYRSGDPTNVRLVDEEGLRARVVVPLINDGDALGCIALSRREPISFTDSEIALVETFAAQAVIAIENVRQFRALRDRTEEVQALNASLEERVDEQVGEIERIGRLKRFLSPAVAEAVISSGDENVLSSHRALIGILFCDIRGFTAFCEAAEPEETIEFLQTYHEEMGNLINAHGAGVDHRMGDGIMVIFNDPFPCDDPAGDALRLALVMRERMAQICQSWRRLGHRLGFGVGISLGYATVGMIGSGGRFDYTASGTAVNMAARLCDQADDGEILLSPRAYTAIEDDFEAESAGEINIKGIRQPMEVFRVMDQFAGSQE